MNFRKNRNWIFRLLDFSYNSYDSNWCNATNFSSSKVNSNFFAYDILHIFYSQRILYESRGVQWNFYGNSEIILEAASNNKALLYTLLIEIYLWHDFNSQWKRKIRFEIKRRR